MTRLPNARIVHSTSDQKQALVRWLHEWRIDGLLREDDRAGATQENHDSMAEHRKASLLYDSKPARAGQIRLYHPFLKETKKLPRYVAVLKNNEDGSWLIAPFSRFSEPAVPGEWKTGRKAPVLRILCIWNARYMTGSMLERSWVVDRLPASKIEHAIAIQRFLAEGKELSRLYANQIGPPLVHPLDPRIEYLEEEREWFSTLSTGHPLDKRLDPSDTLSEDKDCSLPMAAEERGRYRVAKDRTEKRRHAGRDPRNDK
jgi:hypothetical protein